MKQPTTKDNIIDALRKQESTLKGPYNIAVQEVNNAIHQAISCSPEFALLKESFSNLFDSLRGLGLYTHPDFEEFKDITYYAESVYTESIYKLRNVLIPKYTTPYTEQLEHLESEQKAISALYNTIISTVRSLPPKKAKQYIMELQLNIPVEAFMDKPVITILPDDPMLNAVRSQLLMQLGGPTNG